jgi:hypothetical protein
MKDPDHAKVAHSLLKAAPVSTQQARASGIKARRMGDRRNGIQLHRRHFEFDPASPDFNSLLDWVWKRRASVLDSEVVSQEDFLGKFESARIFHFASVDGREVKCARAEQKSPNNASFFLTKMNLQAEFPQFPGQGHSMVCRAEFYVELKLTTGVKGQFAKVDVFKWLADENDQEWKVDLASLYKLNADENPYLPMRCLSHQVICPPMPPPTPQGDIRYVLALDDVRH